MGSIPLRLGSVVTTLVYIECITRQMVLEVQFEPEKEQDED